MDLFSFIHSCYAEIVKIRNYIMYDIFEFFDAFTLITGLLFSVNKFV
jgi:hypothetical protein